MSDEKVPESSYTQEMYDLVELTGCDNWEQVVSWFGGMNEAGILAEVERVWDDGADENERFAARLYSELN